MESIVEHPDFVDLAEREAPEFDVASVRADFPILETRVHGQPLAYFDNAATAQKPRRVIDAIKRYYEHENANIHRGVHHLSEVATEAYENAREICRSAINAPSLKEVIFVKGTTEAINLVAHSYARKRLSAGDEIVISTMEHHSNIVPWQLLCEMTGALLRVVPINRRGELVMEEYRKMLNERTRLVSVVQTSNSLGTINPVREIIEAAHQLDIPVMLDGAQAVPHSRVDVQDLDCDFFAFSGHKVFGPTGIGVLFAKESILDRMSPYQGGGDMIASVTFEKTTYNVLPHRFEAGTPNIAGAIGLGEALKYVQAVGYAGIGRHEQALLEYATNALNSIDDLRIIGTAERKASVVSFVIDGVHAHDVGTVLDQFGIAVRTGHHCTQPVMDSFGVPATSRASFAMYNTKDEIDRLIEAVHKVIELFR